MEAVFDHVVLDHPLTWKVTERVVADWTDTDSDRQRQLGTLNTKTNPQSSPNLTLAVGCRDKCLLFILHVAIKARPSTGSKPKHMFLVLPTESLLHPPVCEVLEYNKVTETTLAALLPTGGAGQASADSKPDGRPGATSSPKRVIKMHVQLKDLGYVIMPQSTIEREIKGSPRLMLEDLQSLSRSLAFDIYLRFNTFAEVGLRHAAEMVRNGLATTPTIHVGRMFNKLGAVDVWDQYLLPPSYKANPPVDQCKSVDEVLVPGTPEGSPVHEVSLATEDDVIKETPPPPSRKRKLPPARRRGGPFLPPYQEPPPSSQLRKRKATSPPPADHSLPDDVYEQMIVLFAWLEWAWTLVPDAHEVFRDDLMALGRALRAGDGRTTAKLRAHCTRCIVLTAEDRSLAGAESGQPSPPRDLERELEATVEWLNEGYNLGDVLLGSYLCAVAKAVRAGDVAAFNKAKAQCIVHAMLIFLP